jgi:tRNA A37 methylthiotransferase MiaB
MWSGMKQAYISTNGCEEGQLKSMQVQQFLVKNGFAKTDEPAQADLIVFFACGLTARSENRSLFVIRELQGKKKESAKLIVWGCLSRINPGSLAHVYDGPLIGPTDMTFFDQIVDERVVSIDDVSANTLVSNDTPGIAEYPESVSIDDPITYILQRLRKVVDLFRVPRQKGLFDPDSFFIRAGEGCEGRCTYCSERCAWGRVKSRPIEKIVNEFEQGLQIGQKRFFLVAGDLGAYGKDIGSNIIDLLRKMIEAGGNESYGMILNQISPIYLRKMFPDFERIFATGKIEALGCQVESGSDRILKLMRRDYKVEDWRQAMLNVNARFPSIRLSTHFMVGFPGETDADFKASLKLLDYPLFLEWIGAFVFSPRPHVYASQMPGKVPEKTKKSRLRKLYRRYLYMYMLNVLVRYTRHLSSKVNGNMLPESLPSKTK